jgi:transcription factor C subunit 6
MPRELRTRKSAINYADLLRFDEDPDDMNTKPIVQDDSGSEFDVQNGGDDDVDEREADEQMSDVSEAEEELLSESLDTKPLTSKQKSAKVKRPKANRPTISSNAKVISRVHGSLGGTASRNKHTLPARSFSDRKAPPPIFIRDGMVERLVSRPILFSEPQTVLTNNFSVSQQISFRINRGLGHNVGGGPLWDLLEDRGWYKESNDRFEEEATRRPIVHSNVRVKDGFTLLSFRLEL